MTTSKGFGTSRIPGDARVIAARKGFVEQLRHLWDYRGLLFRMVRKELQVKYKNSVLGFVWSMLNPALYLVVFYIVFQLVLGNGMPYFVIYLLSGLLVWNLFSTAIATATTSITGNASLVGKVYFPREVLPLASVGAALVHFFLQGFVLLGALVVFRYDISFTHSVAIFPALFVLLLLAAAVGIFLAAANVYLRDTQHLVELALLAWFWMTPIVYPYRLVSTKLADKPYGWIQWLNPLSPIVLSFQRGIYNFVNALDGKRVSEAAANAPNGVHILPVRMDLAWYVVHLGGVALASLVVLLVALRFFSRVEGNFAEEL